MSGLAVPSSGPGIMTLQGAPGSPPPAGVIACWGDSTATTLKCENSSGTIYTLGDIISGATSISGTSGTASCSQNVVGLIKTASCILTAYQETSTAQTYPFPIAFSTTPLFQGGNTACGTYNASTTASTLTLPANSAMTASTCNIVVTGQ